MKKVLFGIDVWRGVWRCTHAKLAPLTPHPLARDRHYGPASGQRGNAFGQAIFLPPFLLCYSSVWTVRLHSSLVLGSIRISGLDGKLAAGCLRSGPAWIIFCFRYWVADGKNRGMARSGIGYWVVAAMGRSCTISILWRIVRATKVATWSHPSALFSIIGTKLSGIRGGSPIFSSAVIASSRYSQNAGNSNRVCQASSSHPLLSQLEHSGFNLIKSNLLLIPNGLFDLFKCRIIKWIIIIIIIIKGIKKCISAEKVAIRSKKQFFLVIICWNCNSSFPWFSTTLYLRAAFLANKLWQHRDLTTTWKINKSINQGWRKQSGLHPLSYAILVMRYRNAILICDTGMWYS